MDEPHLSVTHPLNYQTKAYTFKKKPQTKPQTTPPQPQNKQTNPPQQKLNTHQPTKHKPVNKHDFEWCFIQCSKSVEQDT